VQLARASGEAAALRLAEPSAQGGFHSRLMWADREALRLILLTGETDAGHGPAPRTPGDGRPTPVMQARVKRLKAWRAEEATRRGVGLQAVLPAAVMAHLARHGAEALPDTPGFGAARLRRYGDVLRTVLSDASPER
jgi:hypothetical protein